MKKILAIAFIALTLTSCGVQQYASCNGVDGGNRASCGR